MKTQLSILALAVASTTAAYAKDPVDILLGSAENDITAIVNSDNGSLGDFVVKNGTGTS